ncbi:MAG: hypothetical protein ABI460_06920 [Caldimonas sp.]
MSEHETFNGGRTAPMHFSKPDADALAGFLNARTGAKRTGRPPPTWK